MFALVAALAVGYLGALLFARRLRRLEAAAERIAAGEFDEPVVDHGTDEVGQLARTFDRMRERLAALDHARREFIANASHELRTPIFSLGGFLELMRDEELDEPTRREFLATMSEQVDRLAKLATELLDLSRADAGRLRVERESVDLDEVAETVVDEFAARSNGRSLSFEGGDGEVVLGDEQRVLQIARALVENALVHTPAGRACRGAGGRRRARGRGRRPGDPAGAPGARVRPLLPGRRRARVRQRARARDRARARAGDGRDARGGVRARGGRSSACGSPFSRDVP